MPHPLPYSPDDAHITLDALEFLHNTPPGHALRQAIAALPHAGTQPTVAQIAALRKQFPAAPTHAALTLAKLQPKAAAPHGKFPDLPFVWATPEALEQATHSHVARYKADRIATFKPRHIFDLCAGIGGDTLALANIAPVTAVDLSPVRTTCLRFNLLQATPTHPVDIQVRSSAFRRPEAAAPPAHPVEILTTDLCTLIDQIPQDAWLHIDPARRAHGRRSPRYEHLIPGPEILDRLIAHVQGRGEGAGGGGILIKLSPAVDFDSLPHGHLEIISHDASVVQALLAIGTGQPPAQRTATILHTHHDPWSLTAVPLPVSVAPLPTAALAPASDSPIHLYEVDGALTRAGLAQHLANTHQLLPLTIDGGYLLSHPGTPLLALPPLSPFRLHAIVPFARVPAALPTLPPTPPGPVEVKTRGHLPGIDTDHLQRAWSKIHPLAHTVLLFKHDHETLAALASRPAPAHSTA